MKQKAVTISTADGACDAWVVTPEGAGPFPPVILVMDAFGVRDHLIAMAAKIAEQGYWVLLPNLFYRIRSAPVLDAKFPLAPEQMPALHATIRPWVQEYTPDLAMKDMHAFLDFVAHDSLARPGKVAITGYCMGGSIAVRAAVTYPDQVAAVFSFHSGRLANDDPQSPHRFLDRVKASLYFGHADQDASMPLEQIHRLEAALREAKVEYQSEIYAGAPHGFTMADLPAYRKDADERHWKALLGGLKRYL